MTGHRPKLIEVALPLAAINREAAREKSIRHGHPSTLHLWWARRPLAAARAVIWASLVDDPSGDPSLTPDEQEVERQRLFGILERLVKWENSDNADVLAEARAEIDRCFPDGSPPILDPFAGGGAIPLEAQRLGLTALAGDLNPVAVLINKAMIEIPPRFAGMPPVHPGIDKPLTTWERAQGLAADVEAYGRWMRDEAHKRIGHLYPDATGPDGEKLTPIAWIWARTVESPDPSWSGHVPLVASWTLAKRPGKPKVWIEPIIDRDAMTIRYEIREGGEPTRERTCSGGNGTCLATGAAIPASYIKDESRAGRLGHELIAVVAEGERGRQYVAPTPSDSAAVPNVVVLISIPASDVEVGGPKGRTALEKLKNVVARKAAQWQPASPDESFEIVRRRLFDPIPAEKARVRDGVIRAFCDMYRDLGDRFPAGVGEGEYRRRMELCYPIHPELFDRLFDDWSALDKFQRTRGVLRLMALAISQLWQRDDRSLLIMPGNLPMDYGLLVSEMKKYLEDGWDPVIKADVDGANSLPLRIDQNNSHFGRLSATRRAARAVYMGSAPRPDGRRGVDLKSVVLGCAQPGESPGQFADALRRLSGEATHLYVDGAQYWYSLIPNVTRIAADRAGSNYDDRDADDEVRRRIGNQRDRGAFAAVQVFAEGPGDVPDNDDGVRLIILEPGATHSPNDANSPAVALAERILAQRDAGPRVNPNLVVFLAAAANRLAELRAATRMYLAWKSIVGDQSMNLTAHQQRQADSKLQETSKQVDSLIAETFTLAITPTKQPGQRDVEWQTTRVTAAGDLAERTSAKLQSEEKLIGTYSGVRIRMDLDRRELWSERGDIVVHKLWETYARFPYMPRLANRDVLYSAIANRATTLTWQQETFAYAEAHDGERWVGLHTDDAIPPTPSGLLIHPDHVPAAPEVPESDSESADSPDDPGEPADTYGPPPKTKPEAPRRTQFYAQFNLDPVRCIKQLGDIADHVTSKLGDNVELILEVRANSDDGFDESTHRTVSENAKALGAQSTEFE